MTVTAAESTSESSSNDREATNEKAAGVDVESFDGRRFTARIPLPSSLAPGQFVFVTTAEGQRVMGQVITRGLENGRALLAGRTLGELDADGALHGNSVTPFNAEHIDEADLGMIEALQARDLATLAIGTLTQGSVTARALLEPTRFNRHTFLCGQSGSGKTYALGVLLEQLLINTDLPMVILDPNSDFVHLDDVRPDAPSDVADALSALDIRVLRARSRGGDDLLARLLTMPVASQAAVLQLDPLTDRAEYNAFMNAFHLQSAAPAGFGAMGIVPYLQSTGEPEDALLAQRAVNLGVLEWEIWAQDGRAANEVLGEKPRVTVMDLGSLRLHQEQLATSLAMLDHLWEHREERNPTLIVIDEAHNIVSANPSSPLQQLTTERVIQIAAEGRKFGLWLLLSTQRPSKMHPNVLSQCDNLMVMRMSSPSDLNELASTFGFAPQELLEASPYFKQGEALMAGGFVPAPMIVQMGDRYTVEGGADVRVPLRS